MHEARHVSGATQTTALINAYRLRVPANDNPRGEAFANLIREARRAKNWTQDKLVDESGVSRSTILRWESGDASRPDPDQVRAVCLALGIDPRRAAVALGYLTPEEIAPPGGGTGRQSLSDEEREILTILRDPQVPSAEKAPLVEYLRFLGERRRNTRKTG
jgi:transcriptional regulator with XRE-family HTH domain